MMLRPIVLISLSTLFCCATALSQDTLPRFTVVKKPGNRNLISWTNPFPSTSQISIQRSSDSLKNFITILTVPDPKITTNGFTDVKTPDKIFYRLFIVLDSGKYMFSRSQRPAPDTAVFRGESLMQDNQRVVMDSLTNREVTAVKAKLKSATSAAPVRKQSERFFVVKKNQTYTTIAQRNFKKFRDSIVYTTRDTLIFASVDTVMIKPFVPVEIFRASKYVYTEKFGNVMIALPDAGRKKYSISFFEQNNSPLFRIERVQSPTLVVDKTNFVHSGWFWFELFEDGKLKERHRFFIPRDF